MKNTDKIYVAGHNGMLGSAIVRLLIKKGYNNIITKTSDELNLRNQKNVNDFLKNEKPYIIILAAAKVGSIQENKENPAEFLIENIQIEMNVINSAFKNNIKNLIFVASSTVYPKTAKQPLKEEYILNGQLESENEAYGLSKLIGIKACQYYNQEYNLNYISVLPTNLYGINAKFDTEHSNVIAGIMVRMYNAKIFKSPNMKIWGSGKVYREFINVDDAADAIIFLLENHTNEFFINLGAGGDISIKELAEMMKNVLNYNGELIFDTTKPDGIKCRRLNTQKMDSLGWKPKISLKEGLKQTYEWYLNNEINGDKND